MFSSPRWTRCGRTTSCRWTPQEGSPARVRPEDPLKEYQREGSISSRPDLPIKEESLKRLFHVKVQREEEGAGMKEGGRPRPARVVLSRGDIKSAGKTTQKREGSRSQEHPALRVGKKYKKCCGASA